MKLQTLRFALVLAVLVFALGATTLQAQDPDYRIVAITAADAGTGVGTDTFGVHSQATYCNDGNALTLGGFTEEELPPKPPAGVFDFRFTDHRAPGCLGTGQRLHLQEGGKTDTFKVEFQPSDGGYPFTFTWPSGLDADWSSLVIQDAFGGFLVNVDMLTNTSVEVTNAAITTLNIIGAGKTVDVRREGELVPQRFGLDQNYPNPFNPSTQIRFSIAKTGMTTLKVYDVMGREVSTLVNESLNPGTYSVQFDASNLSSGTYLYVMTSGSTRLTNKMVLVK